MKESFATALTVGGKTNSLGKTEEVIKTVLQDKTRLNELYNCLFNEDAWVRMRAADGLEKVCREKPEWLEPYIDKLNTDISLSTQPSLQWHLAQIYAQVRLTDEQKAFALHWLTGLLASTDVDWIVAANCMDTLVQFAQDGSVKKPKVVQLLKVQQHHKSKAVIRRATKLLDGLAVS